MQINKIRVCGFDKLHDGYLNCIRENRQGFGDEFKNFLSHSMLSVEVMGLTTMEVFYLKQLSSTLKIINKEYKNFVSDTKSEIYSNIEKFLEVHDEILSDDDIDKNQSDVDCILPTGCFNYHVIATFNGSNITSILGFNIKDLFIEDGKFSEVYMGNSYIENKIAVIFYKRLYEFMSESMTSLDIVTSFMMNKKYYQYAESNCNLAHVNTPYGELTFFGNSGDGLNKQVELIKKGQEDSPYHLADNIYFSFIMKTSFRTFVNLFLNTKFITDYNNLKLVLLEESIKVPSEINYKYGIRIQNLVESLNSYKTKLNENTNIDLTKFNYILNGNEIIYSIQLSMTDVENLRESVKKIFEEESKDIVDKIISIVNSVNNLIG